jgi:hypothetical protein
VTVSAVAPVDWDELPPPADLPPENVSQDTTPADGPLCPTCGEVIIRDPSWKRMHKYHDECQPVKGSPGTGRTRRVSTGGKAEKEADRCEEILRGVFVKAALAVSVVDKFDAFCIMVNAPAVCSSFRAVCLRYESFRKEMLRVPEGGSVFGLLASVLFMTLPMAAHHGLIPSKRIAEMMVNTPIMLYGVMNKMQEGEDGLKVMMREHMAAMKQEKEAAAARRRADANGQFVAPSASGPA